LGGISTKPKKMLIFFGFVFDLHTLATPKLGGISTKPKKMLIFFGFVFDLH